MPTYACLFYIVAGTFFCAIMDTAHKERCGASLTYPARLVVVVGWAPMTAAVAAYNHNSDEFSTSINQMFGCSGASKVKDTAT